MKQSFVRSARKKVSTPKHIPVFFQIIGLFVLWALYRSLFVFPDWFDEIFAKGIVFGLPSLLYARNALRVREKLGLSPDRFWCGMYMGLLVGGIYGFVGAFRSLSSGTHVEPGMLFASSQFWYTFFLAMMTGWWESVFFFGYIMNAMKDEYKLPEVFAVVAACIVFVAFHAPLRFMLEGFGSVAVAQLTLLGIFAAGQAILFLRTKSLYSIVISHALWGMVLMIYGTP